MSGALGLRGYLIQTIISLLDALSTDCEGWISVTLEPDLESEKVDILWAFPGRMKAVQIKSSQNQIGKAKAASWAKALQNSIITDEYELVLLGPCSQSVIDIKRIDKVDIPLPKNLDISGLMAEASHKLDKYYEFWFHDFFRMYQRLPSERELIIESLVTRLASYSAMSLELSKEDFNKWLTNTWNLIIAGKKSASDEIDLMRYRSKKNQQTFAEELNVSTVRLQDSLSKIEDRYSCIIEAFYGLEYGEKHSIQKIADDFGTSQSRIEFLKQEGLKALREELLKQESKNFEYQPESFEDNSNTNFV